LLYRGHSTNNQVPRQYPCAWEAVIDTNTTDVNDTLTSELRERFRELDCIHAICRIAADPNASFDRIIQNITETVHLGFKDPGQICVCVLIDGKAVKTSNFKDCPCRLEADITANDKKIGKLEVGYLATEPQGESLFLDEKKKLTRAIAGHIGLALQSDRLKNAFRESEKRFQSLVENAIIGVFQTNREGDILYLNDACLSLFGYGSLQEVKPEKVLARYRNPEDRKIALNILQQTGKLNRLQVELVSKNGEPIVVLLNANLESDVITGMISDIAEHKREMGSRIKNPIGLSDAENIYLRDEIELEDGLEGIIGDSEPIKYVIFRVRQVAPTKTTVLITGETGTGKGLFARFLHKQSDRWNKPIVMVNCASLPANLIESELFGREKGAFTGSSARQIGRFELAHNGTIFLDEIGEFPMELQAKLLRVTEDGEFERLGNPHTVKVDVRIIASTNRDLKDEMEKGQFRKDLYYRLSVFPITIPPLRQRKEDIPLLVTTLTRRFSKTYCKGIEKISMKAMKALENYAWPGNVRELMNIIERSVIVSEGPELVLPEQIISETVDSRKQNESTEMAAPKPQDLVEVEKEHILKTLEETGWRIEGQRGTAQLLGINPSTLRTRIKKLGIKRPGAK
jgi:formate hydrogenlyase transcriptional activator